MTPKQAAKWIIKILLRVSGIFFFVFSVHGVIGKFFEHQTTMSISQQPPQPLKPPAITFCPAEGFDTIKMLDKFSMKAGSKFLNVDPNNEKIQNVSLVKVFKDSSYVIGSQISIKIVDPMLKEGSLGNSLKLGANMIQTPENETYEIQIYEMFTYYQGLCYTMMMDKYMSHDQEDIILIFIEYGNFSSSPFPIEMELAEEVDRFDLITGEYELSSPVRLKANLGSWYKVQGSIERRKSMRDCDFETQDTIAICKGKHFIHQIEALKNCPKKCVPVQLTNFKHLTKDIKDICTSIEDHNCNTKAKANNPQGKCIPPCDRSQYKAVIQETKSVLLDYQNNTFAIQFNYQNNRITVHEEVLLFDFWTMVGTVGGSLGLFIGFSYFDFGVALLDRFL
jgi:hypothetical protein